MRILIVDDEIDCLEMLDRFVRALGHDVWWAVGVAQALSVASGVEAVITDLHLTAGDGVRLARMLQLMRPGMPILFCTGSAPDDTLVHEATKLGKVLYKPFRLAELEREIEDLEARWTGIRS